MKLRLVILILAILAGGCSGSGQKALFGKGLKSMTERQERWTRESNLSDKTGLDDRLLREIRNMATSSVPPLSSTLPDRRAFYAKNVIVIDPGHGNPGNPGATGPGGTLEKDVVLDISYRVKTLLERDGFKVIMTRTGAETVLGNPERAEVANKNKAGLFLRIHADSDRNPAIGGTRTLWYRDDSLQAAQIIQRELAAATGLVDLGVRRQYLVGFFYAKVPAVVTEVAYLSNPREEKLLASPAFQQQAADGIYGGVLQYFDWLSVLQTGIQTSTLP